MAEEAPAAEEVVAEEEAAAPAPEEALEKPATPAAEVHPDRGMDPTDPDAFLEGNEGHVALTEGRRASEILIDDIPNTVDENEGRDASKPVRSRTSKTDNVSDTGFESDFPIEEQIEDLDDAPVRPGGRKSVVVDRSAGDADPTEDPDAEEEILDDTIVVKEKPLSQDEMMFCLDTSIIPKDEHVKIGDDDVEVDMFHGALASALSRKQSQQEQADIFQNALGSALARKQDAAEVSSELFSMSESNNPAAGEDVPAVIIEASSKPAESSHPAMHKLLLPDDSFEINPPSPSQRQLINQTVAPTSEFKAKTLLQDSTDEGTLAPSSDRELTKDTKQYQKNMTTTSTSQFSMGQTKTKFTIKSDSTLLKQRHGYKPRAKYLPPIEKP